MATSRTLIRAGQFAQLARQGAVIVVVLALPRLGLGTDQIGEWELLLYLGYLLGFGWLTGSLQAFLVTPRLADPAYAAAFSRWATVAAAGWGALLLLATYLFREPLLAVLQAPDVPAGLGFYLLFLVTQWPGLFFEQVLVVRKRPGWLVGYAAAAGLGFVVAVLGPLLAGGGLVDALRGLAVFSLLKGVFLLGWLAVDARRAPPPAGFAPAAALTGWGRAAAPLMLYASGMALVTAFDPWFVNYWYDGDEATFAVFRYGARELPFVAAVINGAMVVVLPQLTEATGPGLALLKATARRLNHYLFGGALALLLTADLWWTAVFTPAFAPSLPVFRAYLFVVVSRLLFPTPVLTALGHTRWLVAFVGLEVVLNVGLSLLLAPRFGLVGIVWATVITYTIDKIALMYYLYRKTGIRPGAYTDWRWFGGYVAALGVGYWVVG